MSWPFRLNRAHVPDPEGKEKAKQQLEVSKVLQESAKDFKLRHLIIQHENHFGPTAEQALSEGPRRR